MREFQLFKGSDSKAKWEAGISEGFLLSEIQITYFTDDFIVVIEYAWNWFIFPVNESSKTRCHFDVTALI